MFKPVETADDEQPIAPAASWLKDNLAVTIFVFSLLSGGIGAVISGTLRVAQYDARLDSVEHLQGDMNVRVVSLENDRHERDERRVKLAADLGEVGQRLTGIEQQAKAIGPLQTAVAEMDSRGTSGLAQTRRDIDGQLGSLSQRTAVLESQIHWVADRLDLAPKARGR